MARRDAVCRAALISLLLVFFLLLIARLVIDYVQMFARSWRPTGVMLVVAEVDLHHHRPAAESAAAGDPAATDRSVSLDLSFLVLMMLVQIGIALDGA